MQTDQLPLFDNPPTGLTCEFGGEWTRTGCGPCAGCRAESSRLDAEFQAMLEQGKCDDRGRKLSHSASTRSRSR